jgi:hypothetical protein
MYGSIGGPLALAVLALAADLFLMKKKSGPADDNAEKGPTD